MHTDIIDKDSQTHTSIMMSKTQTTHSTPSQKSSDGQFNQYDGVPEPLWSGYVYGIWGGDASASLVDFEPCCRFSSESVESFCSLWTHCQVGGAQVCRFSIRCVIPCEHCHGNASFDKEKQLWLLLPGYHGGVCPTAAFTLLMLNVLILRLPMLLPVQLTICQLLEMSWCSSLWVWKL